MVGVPKINIQRGVYSWLLEVWDSEQRVVVIHKQDVIRLCGRLVWCWVKWKFDTVVGRFRGWK